MKKTPLTLLSALGAFALAATSAHGQSIFQETFDGLNPTFLNGQGGWTYTGGNANGSPNDALVIAGGLSYTNGTVSHPAGANKLSLLGGGESRFALTLPNTIAAGETFYVSFLLNHVSGDNFTWLGVGGGALDQASSVSLAVQSNAHRTRVVDASNGTSQQSGGGAGLIVGQTRLVVAEIFFGGDSANSTMRMYLDPTSVVQSGNTPIHTDNGRIVGVTELNTLWMRKGGNNGQTDIDQIRIGETWADVVIPEPSTYAALIGLLALGLVAWRRRR
jgi:hypothetical protein